jgi:hypothetical protein
LTEDVDRMESGPELDRIVGEMAMGGIATPFSSSITDAWRLVERLRRVEGWVFKMVDAVEFPAWFAEFHRPSQRCRAKKRWQVYAQTCHHLSL